METSVWSQEWDYELFGPVVLYCHLLMHAQLSHISILLKFTYNLKNDCLSTCAHASEQIFEMLWRDEVLQMSSEPMRFQVIRYMTKILHFCSTTSDCHLAYLSRVLLLNLDPISYFVNYEMRVDYLSLFLVSGWVGRGWMWCSSSAWFLFSQS